MSCKGCSTNIENGKVRGCQNNGGCSTGGCNRMNSFDWLTMTEISDPLAFDYVEISFKNGSRKSFYKNHELNKVSSGDTVVVEASSGYDIGEVNLSGELVRLQMKKKSVTPQEVEFSVIRKANERDLEKLEEARLSEKEVMVKARVIARKLGLIMKLGDVEFQGDKRKATFFYTADGRVDFRELIRHYAKEFRVKIEMRQIGARQESARIGGIGSCGRELCCSTWLTDFKSVSTSAARYQNLAINQAKLSGQCGRLKCCLNYELDTYLEALEAFPNKADRLETEVGYAFLVKTDIFKGLMYYAYEKEGMRGKFYALNLERVKHILALNRKGGKPAELQDKETIEEAAPVADYADVTGFIELPPDEKKKQKRRRPKRGGGRRPSSSNRRNRDKRD